MLPVIEEYGPTAIIYPSLRGIPLVDRWLIEHGLNQVRPPSSELLRSPCLPNRFLAVVPWGSADQEAQALAERCQEAVRCKWRKLAETVRTQIEQRLGSKLEEFPRWADLWDQQIEGFFSVTTTVLPLARCDDEQIAKLFGAESFETVFAESAAVRALAEAIPDQDRPRYDQASVGRWQAQLEISARLMESSRAVRHIPPSTDRATVPGKCSLMGTFEQMGPAGLDDSRMFWEVMAERVRVGPNRIRPGERFCAVALVKRFAPHVLADELGIDQTALRTPDTATVAATKWLKHACQLGYDLDPDRAYERYGEWNGQWLFWTKKDQREEKGEQPVPEPLWQIIHEARGDSRLGPPPAYYAILMMDGDHMGRWLSGEISPAVETVLHPAALAYFKQLNDPRVEPGLKAHCPLGPARHAAISAALANFSLYVVPEIMKQHYGVLIYAGGDDVLAMLPAAEAVACAHRLRLAFSGDQQVNGGARPGYYKSGQRELLMMGPRATASCGLAVVHRKEDLRFALQQARRAEKAAKNAGRDALQIAVCRRSGQHTSVLCPWEFAPTAERWVTAFIEGASDRWAYRLCAEMDTLAGLPRQAVRAELVRQVERSEKPTKEKLAATAGRDKLGDFAGKSAGEVLAGQFDDYLSQVVGPPRNFTEAQAMESFIELCQTASFLARGRTN